MKRKRELGNSLKSTTTPLNNTNDYQARIKELEKEIQEKFKENLIKYPIKSEDIYYDGGLRDALFWR